MGNDITVSVIVSVYNKEQYLGKCVDSVLAQTFPDYELILVNDGSKDASEEIIDRYAQQQPDRIVKINKPNGGVSSANNAGVRAARGEYLLFLDADDYLDREYLERLVRKAEEEKSDLVCSGFCRINGKGDLLETIRYEEEDGQCLNRRISSHGKIYRTDYIRKWDITFPEGKLYEDNTFNLLALFLTPRISFLDYVGYYQLRHDGSITAAPIDESTLPYDELERCATLIKGEAVEGVDLDLFDFTFISFLTYFLLIRFPQRDRTSHGDPEAMRAGANRAAAKFEELVNRHFPDYGKNKYARIGKYRSLPAMQRIGSRVFYRFCRMRKLRTLVWFAFKIPAKKHDF